MFKLLTLTMTNVNGCKVMYSNLPTPTPYDVPFSLWTLRYRRQTTDGPTHRTI